ncbi:MAG TPA: class I SAM-dependent methyltransferase [Verrucomicrobiae bacterium]|nr:class I SAM-dependent methyltransferase [Verrucomicrobiae bacterium]
MNWSAKLRPSGPAPSQAQSAKPRPTPTTAGGAAVAAAPGSPNVRATNGLKEFLWLLSDIEQPRILDLGNVSQATLNFFINKGFRISTEDILRSWKEFIASEEDSLRRMPPGQETGRISQASLAEKFLADAVSYPEENFNGVLVWDLLDYLDSELMPRLMDRLFDILRPGGVVLAMFHSRTPERYHRYRVLDTQSFEMVPTPTISVHARIFQNREILDLFGKFRSSKTFVARDQLREALFLK